MLNILLAVRTQLFLHQIILIFCCFQIYIVFNILNVFNLGSQDWHRSIVELLIYDGRRTVLDRG